MKYLIQRLLFLSCHPYYLVSGPCWGAEPFPDIPIAEKFGEGPDKPADFVFLYDFACGALASLRARMKYMKDNNLTLPEAVTSWALHSKFLVDKFHFKTHVGTLYFCLMCDPV